MTSDGNRRKPEAFSLNDPDLVEISDPLTEAKPGSGRLTDGSPAADAGRIADGVGPRLATTVWRRPRLRWGLILAASLSALGGLALTLSFARFVAIALDRSDWIGWVAFGMLALAGLAFAAIVGREIVGVTRMRRLGRHRRALERALAARDGKAERRALEPILANLADRPELKWPLAAYAEHALGVYDPGDLATLADRDIIALLDGDARRLVAAGARRVSIVSAFSPLAAVTVGWVLIENLRLIRSLATLYGGQPGFVATARLARLILAHIVATGGVALTDDMLGQFLGQDLLRRLSRRLGEGLFNAALTARVGAAAIEVIRPLPYLAASRVRARDFVAELIRSSGARGRSEPQGTPRSGRDRP